MLWEEDSGRLRSKEVPEGAARSSANIYTGAPGRANLKRTRVLCDNIEVALHLARNRMRFWAAGGRGFARPEGEDFKHFLPIKMIRDKTAERTRWAKEATAPAHRSSGSFF